MKKFERLFIIGNGFDLAHGIKSSYKNFRNFLINKYPGIEQTPQKRMYHYEFYLQNHLYLGAKILLNAMDIVSNSNWSDFENALSRLSFDDLLPTRSAEEKALDDPQDICRYLMESGALGMDIVNTYDAWQCLFSEWINVINKQIKFKSRFEQFFNFVNLKNSMILTFNYTETIEILYKFNNIVHIHNKIGDDELVLGHGIDDAMYNPRNEEFFTSSDFDDFIADLEKDTEYQMNKYSYFFNSLDESIKDVYSYGFSYSKVDAPYIKEIIRKISKDATWWFTDYECRDKENIRKKKIRLRNYGFSGRFDVY